MKIKYKFDGYDYEYETDGEELDLLLDIFKEYYGVNHITAKDIICDFSLWDVLEEVLAERYMDRIMDYFEDEAREQFEEDREYDKDKEGFYGVSRYYD